MFVPATDETQVDVGVIDSVYDPGRFQEYNRFERSFDVIDANVGATNPHGYAVLNILTQFTLDPSYHLFMAVDENGRTRDSHLMKALGRAMEYGEVDVVNMSVGADHVSDDYRSCTMQHAGCPLCEVAEEAVDQGITIIAASGNRPQVDAICCPSLSSRTISVGGAVTKCTAEPPTTGLHRPPSEATYPPNAYWVYREDGEGTDEALCSKRGCMPGSSCKQNRRTEPWEKNVQFSDRKPDILAPAHFLWIDEVGPKLEAGTSHAAPIVAAGVVNVYDWARSGGEDVSPAEVRKAIRNTGYEFEGIDRRYFSGAKFGNEIRRMKGESPVEIMDPSGGPFDLLGQSHD